MNREGYEFVKTILQNGSPELLQVAGRFAGLGQNERNELKQGAVPTWFWVVLALGAGAAAGLYIEQQYPNKAPRLRKSK